MLQRFRTLVAERFWSSSFRQGVPATWLAEPVVRQAVNRRITGSPHRWPIEWLAEDVVREPFDDVVSLGCGEGALERDLVRKGVARRTLGLDLSTAALESARRLAREEGLDGLRYERADFNDLTLDAESFGAAFFHQSIHHVENLEGCLAEVARALVPGGLLYLDEYVGPSRHEWRRELLAAADAAFAEVPRHLVRRRRFLARRKCLSLPVDWRDPSEAVRSSEILGVVAKHFEIAERRDYGGNLLALIHPHLDPSAAGETEWTALLEHLLAAEDELLAGGTPSYYSVVVAVRR